MSSQDRRPYLTATALTQAFLDACADNLSNQLEMICEIDSPLGTIYASDRNKYVGDRFYEALLVFPVIERTMGEWLSTEIEFSTLTLELSNVDGRFNSMLPGGANFSAWVNRRVEVKLGLRDVESTYRTIFRGTVTDRGGFQRNTKSLTLVTRDRFDDLNRQIPTVAFTRAAYPDIENDKEGQIIPLVLGDWSTGLTTPAGVTAFVVNGAHPQVYEGARNPVQCVVSVNALSALDTGAIFLRRGSDLFPVAPADVAGVGPQFNTFQVVQNGVTQVDGEPFQFNTGDEFFVKVQGPTLGGFRDNAVAQCRWLLEQYAGLGSGDFHANWTTLRDKASPSQSAIASIKSRVWLQEPQQLIAYVASILEQVRLDVFIDADLKLKLASVHFEDWPAAPTHRVRNWDVERDTFTPSIDDNTNFNRARAAYGYEPAVAENAQATPHLRNQAAVDQVGRAISKTLVYPNLYVRDQVLDQLRETLKLASAFPERIECNLTWRSLLLDVGDFVRLNVSIGASQFSDVPCLVRRIGYDPQGIKMRVQLWSFQQVPFPGWAGAGGGIVGGASATIVQE